MQQAARAFFWHGVNSAHTYKQILVLGSLCALAFTYARNIENCVSYVCFRTRLACYVSNVWQR